MSTCPTSGQSHVEQAHDPSSSLGLALRGTTRVGRKHAPSLAGGDPSDASWHKADKRRRPDPAEGIRQCALPGARLSTLRRRASPARRASCLSVPHRPKPVGSGDQAAQGRAVPSARPAQASNALPHKQARATLHPRPARRGQTQGPVPPKSGPYGTEPLPSLQSYQPTTVDAGGEPPSSWSQAVRAPPPQGRRPPERSADGRSRWRAWRRRQASAAGGTDPPCAATTRAAHKEALCQGPVRRPLRRAQEQAPVASYKGHPCSATTRVALPGGTVPRDGVQQPLLGSVEASLHRISLRPSSLAPRGRPARKHSAGGWAQRPCRAGEGKPSLLPTEPPRPDNHKGRRAWKHPPRAWCTSERRSLRSKLLEPANQAAELGGHKDRCTRKHPASWQSVPAARVDPGGEPP